MDIWDKIKGISIIDWTETDFKKAGLLTRRSIEANGDPLGRKTCVHHCYNLEQEDGIIYLTCTHCMFTEILTNKVKNNVQTNGKREYEWRL